MSTLKTTQLQHPDAASPNIVLAADGGVTATGLVVGKVLQVVSVTKVDSFTTTSGSFVDITGLTLNITPSSASNKILVLSKVAVNNRNDSSGSIQLLRGSTIIGGGTAVGSRVSATSALRGGASEATGDLATNFLDSPASTSSQTYKIQVRVSGGTLGINTSGSDVDSSTLSRTSSTITLMEISA
jgi:hypothetical protein